MTDTKLLILVTYDSMPYAESISVCIAEWLDLDYRAHVSIVENGGSVRFLSLLRDRLSGYEDRLSFALADRNVGFAPGVNLGYRKAVDTWGRPDSIVLLNPDVVTQGLTIMRLVDFAREFEISVASPVLKHPDTGDIDSGLARRRWNWRRLLAEVSG